MINKFKMKLLYKVMLFSITLVILVILGVRYLNTVYLQEFYENKRIAQIMMVRDILNEDHADQDEVDKFAQRYNITINKHRPRANHGRNNKGWEKWRNSESLKMNKKREGNRIIKVMGMEQIEFYKELDTGELLTLRVSMDSIKSTVGIVNEFFIYSGIVILLVSLIFVYLFSMMIVKPVITLNEIIKGMVSMDFSYRANLKSGDEMEELGNNINFLAFELEKNMGNLKLSNNKLKEKIEKIEKIDALRQEFIASVTHEIKTPVTVINTHAEMLLYDLVEKKEEQQSYLKTIMSEGDNISELLNELIKLIKLEEDIKDLKLEDLDIKDLILEEVNKYMIDLDEKEVKLNLNLGEDLMVVGDDFKLKQVLTNVISNAVSYVEKNGILDINLKRKDNNLNKENNNEVLVEVINTGPKIPEEKLENVWKAFYRVEKSRNKKYGGTGLGLTIVSEILAKHKSDFGIKNTSNGVKFWFTLQLGGKNNG